MAKVFRKKLTDNGLTEAELTKAVEKWENNQSHDWEEAKNSEKNLNQKIGSSVVKKRVNEIENRIKSCLKSGSKGEMVNVLKDLLGLINEAQNNTYLTGYKNKLEQQAKSLESAISSGSNKEEQTGNKGFFQPKVLIPVGLGAVILGVLAVIVIRSQRRKRLYSVKK